jgi:hypothetical protein
MAKLIDDMRVMRARQTSLTDSVTTPDRYIEGEGGPCPFCDGRAQGLGLSPCPGAGA